MHLRRALALSLAVPLLLVGCTEEGPTPDIPDPTTSSPTPTPEETETPEAESAEEFVRRWVQANTEMQNTGDIATYADLSRKCTSCLRTAERIEQIYADGGYVRTEGWVLRDVVDRSGTTGGPVLDLDIRSSPTEFKESAGAELQKLSGGEIVMRVRLNRGAPWQVLRLTQVPS